MQAEADEHSMQDCPGGEVYALGKALFVIPKATNQSHQQNGLEQGFTGEKKETEAIVSSKEIVWKPLVLPKHLDMCYLSDTYPLQIKHNIWRRSRILMHAMSNLPPYLRRIGTGASCIPCEIINFELWIWALYPSEKYFWREYNQYVIRNGLNP